MPEVHGRLRDPSRTEVPEYLDRARHQEVDDDGILEQFVRAAIYRSRQPGTASDRASHEIGRRRKETDEDEGRVRGHCRGIAAGVSG